MLPDHFRFSQSNLSDYRDCARRFELRYIQNLKWPAVQSEPVLERERHMQQGTDFHRLVHQHLLGVPEDVLSRQVMDERLARWWRNYLDSDLLATLPARRYPEIDLITELDEYRLVAKFDLLAIQPGERAVIVDWKTSERMPKRDQLAEMTQTSVYPYILVAAGQHFNDGQHIPPEEVQMIYWFAEHSQSEVFTYSQDQYEADDAMLTGLVTEIKDRETFHLTPDTRKCRFCAYRSLCDRGISAGTLDELSDDFDLTLEDDDPDDFDLDQIAEIEF